MAQKHLYGRAISFIFRPAVDDEDVSAYSLTSARIYGPNSYPTEAQIKNLSGGEIQAVTSWTATGENEYTIAFNALVDSTPTSPNECDTYTVAVNYKLDSGGADVFDVEQIFVYRPDSATSKIDVTVEDVFALESRLQDVAPSSLWVENKIGVAVEEIVAKLEARGYKKRRVFNWQKLNAAAARKAAALCCSDLASEGSQFWYQKAESWEKSFERMFDSAAIGYDIDGADRPGVDEKRTTGAVYLTR